jgi:hypothetical protein
MSYHPDDPEFTDTNPDLVLFTLICPECGVANPDVP